MIDAPADSASPASESAREPVAEAAAAPAEAAAPMAAALPMPSSDDDIVFELDYLEPRR